MKKNFFINAFLYLLLNSTMILMSMEESSQPSLILPPSEFYSSNGLPLEAYISIDTNNANASELTKVEGLLAENRPLKAYAALRKIKQLPPTEEAVAAQEKNIKTVKDLHSKETYDCSELISSSCLTLLCCNLLDRFAEQRIEIPSFIVQEFSCGLHLIAGYLSFKMLRNSGRRFLLHRTKKRLESLTPAPPLYIVEVPQEINMVYSPRKVKTD